MAGERYAAPLVVFHEDHRFIVARPARLGAQLLGDDEAVVFEDG